jgi:hypothetical protein
VTISLLKSHCFVNIKYESLEDSNEVAVDDPVLKVKDGKNIRGAVVVVDKMCVKVKVTGTSTG